MNPPVSIIIPCLDPGERLRRCLQSLKAQTYPHIEIIVVDGGSSDGTVDLLRGCHDLRWVSEPDDGQSEAINKGLLMASGELLTWLNSDDTLYPHAVQEVVDASVRTKAGLIYGRCEIHNRGSVSLWDPPPTLSKTSFNEKCVIPQQGTFFSQAALEKVGLLDPSFDLALDYDLWIRMIDAGTVHAFVPGTLGTYEIHDESKSGSLSYWAFLLEGSKALFKSGRRHAASIMAGRAAAQKAFEDAVEAKYLWPISINLAGTAAEGLDLDLRLVATAARIEIASLEATRRPAEALRLLAAPRAWFDPMLGPRVLLAGKVAVANLSPRLVRLKRSLFGAGKGGTGQS